jgi:predicted RNA binding protein YcfA (HicA-like mRNA interferase family)
MTQTDRNVCKRSETVTLNSPVLAYLPPYRDMPMRLILADMSGKLCNWNYRRVTNFLKEHGFSYQKPLKGSHQAWIKHGENGELDRRVEVSIPYNSYHPKTVKNMIRQSGIDADEWIK